MILTIWYYGLILYVKYITYWYFPIQTMTYQLWFIPICYIGFFPFSSVRLSIYICTHTFLFFILVTHSFSFFSPLSSFFISSVCNQWRAATRQLVAIAPPKKILNPIFTRLFIDFNRKNKWVNPCDTYHHYIDQLRQRCDTHC